MNQYLLEGFTIGHLSCVHDHVGGLEDASWSPSNGLTLFSYWSKKNHWEAASEIRMRQLAHLRQLRISDCARPPTPHTQQRNSWAGSRVHTDLTGLTAPPPSCPELFCPDPPPPPQTQPCIDPLPPSPPELWGREKMKNRLNGVFCQLPVPVALLFSKFSTKYR